MIVDRSGLDGDANVGAGVLYGVIDEVGKRRANLFHVSADGDLRAGSKRQTLRRDGKQSADAHSSTMALRSRCLAHALREPIRPVRSTCSMSRRVAIGQHDSVEFFALVLSDGTSLKGLEV